MEKMVSFQIKIATSELQALKALAQREYRDFRQQAGILIQAELKRRDLLHKEDPQSYGEALQDKQASDMGV